MTGFLSRLGRNRKQRTHIWSAVVVAAGTASRMEGIDKILTTLGDLPVLVHTLRVFEECPDIAEVVVVTREDLLVEVSRLCREFALEKVSKVVVGGKERIYSVQAGLAEVRQDAELIAIHDGARPLLPPEVLKEALDRGAATGAAAPAIPVTDTVKRAEGGVAQETLDRSTLFAVQTPQVFQADLIRAAIHRAVEEGAVLPEDAAPAAVDLWTVGRLARAGFAQYEISNFAKPGHESRHNLRYWLTRPYIGFGPGAHSDFGGRRYSFVRDLDAYIKGVLEGGNILDSEELIPRQERCGEYLMLRLRTALGIEEWEYRRNYFMDFAPLERRLEEFQAQGWAEKTAEGRWRFTPKGFLVSNQLIGDLLDRQEQAQLSDVLVRAREHYAARGPEEG